MRWNKVYILTLFLVYIGFISACSSGDGGTDTNPPMDQVNLPAKAIGVLPANGEPCSEYEPILDNENRIRVAFQWNTAQFAQRYILVVMQNNSEVFRNSFTSTQTEVDLDRGATYTWRIISVNQEGETNGDTFSFTTPGTPIGNFAPYAAEITIDFDITSMDMAISWIGSDEDGDTLQYDITVQENETVIIESSNQSEDFLELISYMEGADYIVEVISRDTFGNFSVSRSNVRAPN